MTYPCKISNTDANRNPEQLFNSNSLTAGLGIKLSPSNKEISWSAFQKLVTHKPLAKMVYVPVIGGQELYNNFNFEKLPHSIMPDRLLKLDKDQLEILNIELVKAYTHSAPAKAIMQNIEKSKYAFACAETSSVQLCFLNVPKESVILKHKLIIFPTSDWRRFAILQSDLHTKWAWQWGLRRKADLVYSPKRCAATFPLPSSSVLDNLDDIGMRYYQFRQQFLIDWQLGLTATYNLFHDSAETVQNIAQLRQLHVEMDNAVVAAYGWQDLDLDHGFHETPQGIRYTISELARREVLSRLLQLNYQRYEEEVKLGLHEKKGKKKKAASRKKKAPKKNDGQMSLL